MSSAYDNTVFDFDLDFLNQPPPNNAVTAEPDLQARCDRLRKSVIFFKKRVKVIDHYVTVAKAAKNEIAELRITETQLKNQCRQHHVEIGNFIEKVTRLENEVQAAEVRERQKNETISELENNIEATQKVYAQYKLLAEEHKLEVSRKKEKANITNNTKKTFTEKEVETLRKNNAKFINLEKINENLRKDNSRIPYLEKEIENLRKNNTFVSEKGNDPNDIAKIKQLEKDLASISKENARISKLETEIKVLQKENSKISELEKEIEYLQKEKDKIPKLMKEIENLHKEKYKIPKMVKEIENLHKENDKIPKLMKEIENLHKENAKCTKLRNETETLVNLNIKISNLEKDNEFLRIKNTEIETENKALRKKIDNIPSKGENIGTQLTYLNTKTQENGKSENNHKLTGKHKSLPDKQGEKSDDSEAENDVFEDPVLSPIPNDTMDKESVIAGEDIAVPLECDTEYSTEYLVNNSPNGENIENERKTISTTNAGSPTLLKEIENHDKNQNIGEIKSVSHRKSHSTNGERKVSNCVDTSDNVRPKKRTQEKECLEINNSLRCESHTELELENIFSKMKLNYNVISPIPKTPTNVDSTCSPSEKFDMCSSLCYKTIDFMQTLIRMAVSQGRDRDKVNVNDCDKMIECFESILKSKQILTETVPEHSVLKTNSNMKISDCVLERDDDNLGTESNPEPLIKSSQNETHIYENNRSKKISQNESLLQEENELLCNDSTSIIISNPSSTAKGTNINREKQIEKGQQCSPMSIDESNLINHSVSDELATDNSISKDTDSDGFSHDIIEVNQHPIVMRKVRNKKKTKLDKLKKKLEPKYKIKMETAAPVNFQVKPKQLLPIKRKITENDSSASLNRKDIYEKAVKFMAQLNSQQGFTQAKTPPKHTKDIHKPRRHTACLEKYFESSGDNPVLHSCSISTRNKRKISELFDACTVVLIKDPLLVSPRKSEKSTTERAKEHKKSTIHRAKEDPFNEPLRKRLRRSSDKLFNIFSMNAKEDQYSTTDKAKEDNNSTIHREKENETSTTHEVIEGTESSNELPLRKRLRCTSDKTLNVFSSNAKEYDNFTTDGVKENQYSTIDRAKEDNNSSTDRAKEDTISSPHKVKEDTEPSNEQPLRKRLRSTSDKPLNNFSSNAKEDKNSTTDTVKEDIISIRHKVIEDIKPSDKLSIQKRLMRSSKETLVQHKRVLRSANVHTTLCMEDNNELPKSNSKNSRKLIKGPRKNESATQINDKSTLHNLNVVNYEDLDVFSEHIQVEKKISDASRCSYEPLTILPMDSREDNNSTTHRAKEDNISTPHRGKESSTTNIVKEDIKSSDELPLQKGRRRFSNEVNAQYKRVLRSATVQTKLCTEDNTERSKLKAKGKSIMDSSENNESATQINDESTINNSNVVSYEDLDVFSQDKELSNKMSAPVIEVDTDASNCDPRDSILCYMIKKYAMGTVRRFEKNIQGKVITNICEKLEKDLTIIIQNHCSQKAKDNLVADLRKLNYKHFIAALIQFLAKPERKLELFGKVRGYPAPAMTKNEQILLYVIAQLKNYWPSVDIVDAVLSSIEFTLFKLNKTPDFDVIESTSHFYAVLCRFVKAQSRLRLFILDAMYCIQFKSVPLIKQCLEVWMSLIPLSHMGIAKTPMVTCLVYLLHFYKCDDRYNRVQEIRKILREQYFYKITNWSETKILEMFKNSIADLRDISMENKMLRLALIILAKRRGPQWCQLHIIQNLLQPMIEKKNVPNNVKQFCVSVIGPLMKPYPANMKVYCEIAINQLLDILDSNPTPEMEEAALTSMMIINRHDQHSLNKMLMSRKMKPMSVALEKTIRDYVKGKPLKTWEMHLATIALELENHCNDV